MLVEEQKQSFIKERKIRNGHRGGVIWFTGLSGSGKTTLAMKLERCLFEKGGQVLVLDGDNLRHGMCKDLGFSQKDRVENIRRVISITEILVNSGMLVLTAFISPYKSDRAAARKKIGGGFYEIFLDPGLKACETRDPKGLYKKARDGKIKDFTGISAPYEEPLFPELKLNTALLNEDACTKLLYDFAVKTFFNTTRPS